MITSICWLTDIRCKMIRIRRPEEHPAEHEIVMATNTVKSHSFWGTEKSTGISAGYLGLVYWSGKEWRQAESDEPTEIAHWIEITVQNKV